MKKITVFIFSVLIAFFHQGLNASEKLKVTASFYPLAHFAEKAGGKHVEVVNIMPPGAEPHEYEPTPRDIKKIYESNIFIFNGAGLDTWAEKLKTDLKKHNIHVVEMAEHLNLIRTEKDGEEQGHEHEKEKAHEHVHGEYDPHTWLDPLFAQKEIEVIRDAIIIRDPANADLYKGNSTAYINDLHKLHDKFRAGLKSCRHRDIIVTHDAFNYLAKRYDLICHPIMGISPEEEPSPRKMVELSKVAREKNIKYIFFESLVSPKIAETIAKEVGAKTIVLNPIGGLTKKEIEEGKTYISVMEENLDSLRLALSCN